MNRELILINGALESQSEWLGKELANENYSQLFVEHISGRSIARALGHSALSSLNSVALYDAMSHSLSRHNNANVVLVSNYPQHLSQIDDIYELAILDGRRMSGLIVPDSPESDAIQQIISEHHTALTTIAAKQALGRYRQNLDPIILELRCRDLPMQFVDMSHSESTIMRNSIHSMQYLITPDDIENEEHAS